MTVFWRRRLLAVACLAALVAIAFVVLSGGDEPAATDTGKPTAAELAEKPNVVVLMTDDQTLASMSALPKTRRLIGGAGVTFERFYATDPLCCPSRATFQTGQYAHNHGVISNSGPNGLPALRQHDTLGVWMQRAGYSTSFVGKYFNDYTEEDPGRIPPGWDDWHALVDPSTQNYVEYRLNDNGTLNHYGPGPADYKTTVLGEKARAAIGEYAGRKVPFFLYVGFNAPHAPATPAPQDAGVYAGRAFKSSPNFAEADLTDKPSFLRDREPVAGLADRVVARQQNVFESLVEVDRQVADIVAALDRAGELDNTYIAFTSDNGYFAGEHGIEYGKLLPYEEAAHLPLLVRGPGVPAGETSDALVGNVDLAPTIAQIADALPNLELDGESLIPFATDPERVSERPLVIESLVNDRSSYFGIPYAALRTDRYLYVDYENGEEELYDLERDPFQLESRHADPAYAATKAALGDALAERRDCAGEACGEPLAVPPDPD